MICNIKYFVAFQLHLAALTSLKSEILDLSGRLQHVTAEKETVEKQLSKHQVQCTNITNCPSYVGID